MAKERGKRSETDAPAAAARYVRRSAESMRARGARIGEPVSVHRSEFAALSEWASLSGKRLSFSFIANRHQYLRRALVPVRYGKIRHSNFTLERGTASAHTPSEDGT